MPQFRLTWRPDATCPKALSTKQLLTDPLGQHALSVVAPTIVEAGGILDLRPLCPPVDNQGQVSDCVADATSSALELLQIKEGHAFNKLSRLFLYYNARLQTGDTDKDDGTYVHLAFSTLTTLGTCPEVAWAYDPTMVFTRPSWAAYQQAYPNKTAAFYGVPDNAVAAGGSLLVSAAKQALQANHPVVFGMNVDDAYQGYSGGIVPMPGAIRPNLGGHCQLMVGYDNNTQCWLVQNSWGSGWGEGGYAWLPWAYVDASQANDFWVPTLVK